MPATVEIDLSCLRRRLFSLAVKVLLFRVSGKVRNKIDSMKSIPADIRNPGNHIPTHLGSVSVTGGFSFMFIHFDKRNEALK